MVFHLKHEMLARQSADDTARSRFVLALKRQLVGPIRSANGLGYKVEGAPAFVSENGREPKTRDEALTALTKSRHYRYWSALNRTSQELMWETVAETIYRDQDRLETAARKLTTSNDRKGSLNLDPDFEPDPAYTGTGIHLQPHSYVPDDDTGTDVLAGAFYEMGGRLYSMGRGMAARDSKAESVLRYLRDNRPGWSPGRVLDMGCSAGGASVPYAEAFKHGEVHGVDLGSSMLRYAHARAEALGVSVHFHQMDAAATPFPDEHFDLIVSHNLFHEISTSKRKQVAKETMRLLKPGGIAIHQDVNLLFRNKEVWEEAERSWDLYHNHEIFWLDYAESDFLSELVDAGFDRSDVDETVLSKTSGPGGWQIFVARKPA